MPRKIRNRGNGAYQFSIAVGYDDKGKQIIKTKTVHASSDREAEKMYNLFAAEVQKGEVSATGKYKLFDFARDWFQKHCEKNLAPKTLITYRNHLEKRILPALGYMDIHKIRPQHIMEFMESLEDGKRYDGRSGGISAESARYCFRVLSSMLQDAVQWQIITSNPCSRVKPPSVKSRQINTLKEDNVKIMLDLLQKEPIKYKTIIFLAIDSGLRLGELMALKWDDIDFGKKILSVTKSNQALKGRGIFTKAPKNLSSVRQVALSEFVCNLLLNYKKEQEFNRQTLLEKWQGSDWIFTQWNGLPMYPTTPSQWFRKFLKRNGLPHMPFHGLRHLSATLLIAQGVPLKNVSSRLGHADIRTTANIYSAALQSVDREAAKKMDKFLSHSDRPDDAT